ncbi:hypothetical protein PGT21_035827 [Puccinia graminis f. sp. tritici]|uniref:HAT C-terminal dimerisation domain-containing protein n=1 Tax=Puccinia graminis f. sp. tritici TaxID=56615 RepID=A0A5B0PB29_PUCGR|nr:hypothetical protein PGT21_035827 [Puccinia graminis f. sp. tritici]KAA1100329.1 hypothetical protein PGTUg99_017180 [Puccinia graminis f. sp. tritici]
MHIFELAFGSDSSEVEQATSLLNREFGRVQEKLELEQPSINVVDPDPDVAIIDRPSNAGPQSLMARLAMRTTQQQTPQENEIEAFLKADLNFKAKAINDKATPLKWWKANQKSYPILATMARLYLGSVGSSCAVERLFSAAADVCSSNRGRLLPSTISHCVSSLMWLREEVPLLGAFSEAGQAFAALLPSEK